MKIKGIYIVLFVLTNLCSFGQSVNDLDLKNGFRSFKLGTSPSENKNIIKVEKQNPAFPNVVVYKYLGKDLESVFGIKVESVKLSFYKNKLFSISINFGDFGKSFELYEYNTILSTLKQVYGAKYQNPSNEDGIIMNGAIWDGKHVKLELLRIDFSKSITNPTDYGHINGYIQVMDKKIMKEMFESQF